MTERVDEACRLHVDGAARGNPGPAAAAAVLYDAAGNEVWADAKLLGVTTNNVAEYEALIMGLEAAAERCSTLSVAADSELVVRQLAGHYRVRQPHLMPLYEEAKRLMGAFASVRVEHVPRKDNARADELANEALDKEACAEPGAGRTAVASGAGTGERTTAEGYYELTVKGHFDAAHSLRGYPGKCKELHGHTWDIEVTVGGSELNDIGILCDFGDLKSVLAEALAPLDHAHLNEVAPFDDLSPTGENLARYLHDVIEAKLPASVELVEVVVWESPIARLSYRK
jgi:queuosine biosynthesis protein QueD